MTHISTSCYSLNNYNNLTDFRLHDCKSWMAAKCLQLIEDILIDFFIWTLILDQHNFSSSQLIGLLCKATWKKSRSYIWLKIEVWQTNHSGRKSKFHAAPHHVRTQTNPLSFYPWESYSCLHTLPPWLEQMSPLHVDLLLSSLSGGERQPRVQPAVSGPLWRGQTEGWGATHHQENYQRHLEGAQPQKHSRDR